MFDIVLRILLNSTVQMVRKRHFYYMHRQNYLLHAASARLQINAAAQIGAAAS